MFVLEVFQVWRLWKHKFVTTNYLAGFLALISLGSYVIWRLCLFPYKISLKNQNPWSICRPTKSFGLLCFVLVFQICHRWYEQNKNNKIINARNCINSLVAMNTYFCTRIPSQPLHAKPLTRSFHFFNSDDRPIVINGWRAAGIIAAVARRRNDDWQAIIDPFARMSLN